MAGTEKGREPELIEVVTPGSKRHTPSPREANLYRRNPLQKIVGVRLPRKSPSDLFDITLSNGRVSAIQPHDIQDLTEQHCPDILNASGQLLAPSLCHAHIHLDKCFLLQDPNYADLEIVSGDFDEAMRLTSQAKLRFQEEDLLRRGRQLIEESIGFGVTSMRSFVEVDADVHMKCLRAGIKLKEEFAQRCYVQICAFAQLPLFSGEDGGQPVRQLMEEAMQVEGVDVVGSTPYVEHDEFKMKMNLRWISSQALRYRKELDLHMDYHLNRAKPAFVWTALDILKEKNWAQEGGKGITMGHCSRLTLFEAEEWHKLRACIGTLPVTFVGLPTSDILMMRTESAVRGTLQVPKIIRDYRLNAAIAVNNVGNAFTPQGSCDPLAVASLGVGLYQSPTKQDTELLYECVSSRAKAAIGVEETPLELALGAPADFVIFRHSGWRTRKSIAEVVYDPGNRRRTIFRGILTTC